MKKITIPDKTPIGIAGNEDEVNVAIFLGDEEPIELSMSLNAAINLVDKFMSLIQQIENGPVTL